MDPKIRELIAETIWKRHYEPAGYPPWRELVTRHKSLILTYPEMVELSESVVCGDKVNSDMASVRGTADTILAVLMCPEALDA
jgi:hypothetical protein